MAYVSFIMFSENKYVKMRFENPTLDRNASENFCVTLYTKYLYYSHHFFRKLASIYLNGIR